MSIFAREQAGHKVSAVPLSPVLARPPARHRAVAWAPAYRSQRKSATVLAILFFLTLPLVNPWVRGDGVGYYAYVRSLMVEHKLDFTHDWRYANESFSMGRVRQDGTLDPREYTSTGHLDNHFAVGTSILWAPFLLPVHVAMVTLRKFGVNVEANGFSRPYTLTLAVATALYGFLGLLICFRLASRYVEEHWALLATLGVWFASSLPVYMYFNPSWSHTHSAFAVTLFLWYWERTRASRTPLQWVVLGFLSGLMLDVYYLNVAVLLIPILESLQGYARCWQCPVRNWAGGSRLFLSNVAYGFALLSAFLPTLLTRKIIYGRFLELGYAHEWSAKPALLAVLFSPDHGLLTWTPVLIAALAGWALLQKKDQQLSTFTLLVFLAFYLLVSFHTNWDGLSSFGNRFFVSLTPFFILGLGVSLQQFASLFRSPQRAVFVARGVTAALVLWNLAFIFQWGTHIVPARGPISWRQMVRNQFVTVPQNAGTQLAAYFRHRKALMNRIEQQDVQQLKEEGARGGK